MNKIFLLLTVIIIAITTSIMIVQPRGMNDPYGNFIDQDINP